MKIDKIIAISSKPGLYEIKSQTKGGVIVESLQDKKRFPVNSVHNISTLSDIAIYTYEEEVPLKDVFFNIFKKEEGKKAIDHKSKKEELLNYFSEVLPDYDEERVYPSNIKKVLQWYNALVDAKFDFTSLEEEEEAEEK
ncbi:MAG: hypothetical protein GQ552_02330 [Flavobacteriaceae bacterium]|nr:hypothetical protein [Flavobacteriaceae bacterium]